MLISFDSDVRRLYNRLLRGLITKEEFQSQLDGLLASGDATREFKMEFADTAAAQFDWIQNNTMNNEQRQLTEKIFRDQGNEFARLEGEINQELVTRVSELLGQDKWQSEIKNAIEDILGKELSYAETLTNTAIQGFSRVHTIADVLKQPEAKMKYVGPPAERPFCQHHLGNTYTIAEIRRMSNGQGLWVLIYCGGYNCKHRWLRVY